MQPHALLLAGALAFCNLLSAASAWRPVTPEDLAARPPAAEPTANGLVLLREFLVDASKLEGTDYTFYYRAKVFTAAGVEELNKTEIPFERSAPPRELAARVVKPDGRIIDVAGDAFFTRDVVRAGGESISVKAFAFAGLEPGDIAEYRFRVHDRTLVLALRYYIDDAFPTALARIRIGVVSYPELALRILWPDFVAFQSATNEKKKDVERVYEARQLPGTIVEPFSPPDDTVKPWLLYYYTFEKGSALDYWNRVADGMLALSETYLTPKKPLKDKALALLAGTTDDNESIRRLYEFCRTQIRNISYPGSGYTTEEIEQLKENTSSVETLKNGYGTAVDINLLFGALLRASGRPCQLAYCSDRSQSFFDKNLRTSSALPHWIIAVDSAGWKFYDPGARHLPPGRLNWNHEAATALVAVPPGAAAAADKIGPATGGDKPRFQFIDTPKSTSAYSVIRRNATFTLSADGTLEGDIMVSPSGHTAFAFRHRFSPKTETERQDLVTKDLRERLGQVEVTDCRVQLPDDIDQPPSFSCHIKIADYATVLGDRLLLPLAFFQKGLEEVFSATTRKSNIYFPFFLAEEDKISVAVPEGFELEPPGFFEDVGGGDKVHYSPRVSIEDGGRRILFERSYARRVFMVPVDNYGVLREIYSKIVQQDARTFSFRSVTAAPSEVDYSEEAAAK